MPNSEEISMEALRRALNDPLVRNSKPNDLIQNLVSVLGISDMEPVTSDEVDSIRQQYFQAIKLAKDDWAPLPGVNYVQIKPFRLKTMPKNVHLQADVLIDKSDYELECFNNYIRSMNVRGQNIVFTANTSIPVDITIGLACIDDTTEQPVFVPDECFRKKPN